ncbi:pilus assembly protein [Brevibacillus reuszeri]|uniref:Pilus assembly protein n=1 Tax=Brevibacillus reuszeri TaxID=54915 RepID=A0A0K9YTD7_9BACL|nr:acetyltransferase [Brevibacillus reuszeri]KNB71902.1 sugar acetyltransferase [Brevibacillus reuszeri]MED1855264.1 acetyltransferase [Brevibacillus reuszeri]GED67585.1 pilus assembly protein [Brevibacillus reuszeri]
MKPIIVLGGGGHAKVVMEVLQLRNQEIIGFTDPLTESTILGISWLGNDEIVNTYSPEDILLVNGLGSVCNNTRRKRLFHFWKEKGFSFANVIHPSAIVSTNAILDEGVQIMAGAVIQAGVRTGSNSIINTRAAVDHDTSIGKHVHIAPGVTLSGGIIIEDDTHVGTGAVVIQGLTIGRNSMVAAGAVVVKDVPADSKVAGVPARNM